MAVRPILLYPEPILKQSSVPVSLPDPAVPSLVEDLLDTLAASPGVALAAPQIGAPLRIIVVDVTRKPGTPGHGPVVLINPRILHRDDATVVREGCLSVPDYTGSVRRYRQTVVEGIAPDGRILILTASGLEALAFQHEIDHLEGVLFLDRIVSLSTDLFRRRKN